MFELDLNFVVFVLLAFLLWNYLVLPYVFDPRFTLVTGKDVVSFFPTFAYPSDTSEVFHTVPIHAWVTTRYQSSSLIFNKKLNNLKRFFTAYDKIRQWLTARLAYAESKARLEQTVSTFMLVNRRAVKVHISFVSDGQSSVDFPFASLTGPNGHVHESFQVPSDFPVLRQPNQRIWQFKAALPTGDDRQFCGEARLLRYHGINIISDIDDTVRAILPDIIIRFLVLTTG